MMGDTNTTILKRIEEKLDNQAERCHEHHIQIQELYGKANANEIEIACIKTEKRALVWAAGIIGAIISFVVDIFVRK